ncbi:MAG: sulfite exporter TauE/SafE family protein [Spirochaetaceae bacterium]
MDLSLILLTASLYFLGGFVQGLTGFAYGLIVVPALAVVYPTPEAVGMAILPGGAVVLYNFFLHRHGVEYRRILRFGVAGMVVLPLGALFLYSLPQEVITGVLGGVVIVLIIWNITMVERSRRALGKRGVGYIFTLIAGLLGGAFATPGPGMVAYLYASDPDRMRAKSNVQFYFVVMSVGILATHIVAGSINASVAARSAPFIPVVLASVFLGARLSGKVDAARFKTVTDVALVVVGLYLVASAIVPGL